ncbi:MAG: hypothetical protein JO316_25365, partial [Abitibacteriaceae bacterium]|nr:hypothetical protein [Abditibacteriaceae bacterium]
MSRWLSGRFVPVALCLFLLATCSVAHAASFTYTGNATYGPDNNNNGACTAGLGGGDSSNWDDARNWGPPCAAAGVPGPDDDATINNGDTVVLGRDRSLTNFTLGSGTLIGGNTLSVSGTFTWTGGTIGDGTASVPTINVAAGAGQLNISGNADKVLNNGVLSNAGTGTWSGGGNIDVENSAAINNSGTFTVQTDASIV